MRINNEQYLYWISEEQETIFPGCKKEDYGLSLELDEKNNLISLFSYNTNLNKINLNVVHPLELEFLLAESLKDFRCTKECLDYQLNKRRISKEYYEQMSKLTK
jgi:hypothetical protein